MTTSSKKEHDKITELPADKIIEPVDAMRTEIDRDKVYELAESIKKQGLINPLTVRPAGQKYEIVAGHRRFKACAIAGLFIIPCVVRTMTDDEVFALRAHENLFREDVDPVDEAIYIGKLVGEDEAKIPQVAKNLNRSEQWVEDRLAILHYPDYFLPALKAGTIKIGVAKALAQVGDDVYRKMFFDNAIRDGMTVFQADYYLAQWQNGVYAESSKILPPDPSARPSEPIKVRQMCEKCGQIATTPNLKTVFIHIDCPSLEAGKTSDTDHDKS